MPVSNLRADSRAGWAGEFLLNRPNETEQGLAQFACRLAAYLAPHLSARRRAATAAVTAHATRVIWRVRRTRRNLRCSLNSESVM